MVVLVAARRCSTGQITIQFNHFSCHYCSQSAVGELAWQLVGVLCSPVSVSVVGLSWCELKLRRPTNHGENSGIAGKPASQSVSQSASQPAGSRVARLTRRIAPPICWRCWRRAGQSQAVNVYINWPLVLQVASCWPTLQTTGHIMLLPGPIRRRRRRTPKRRSFWRHCASPAHIQLLCGCSAMHARQGESLGPQRAPSGRHWPEPPPPS